MATYVVGDIQGCYEPLRRLLEQVKFNPKHDCLWCVGDLVNRGPDSLKTLRFLKSLGDACICVLGNHDLHLLAKVAGGRDYPRDTLTQVLKAEDVDELIEWLRFRPLLHHDPKKQWCMVHAGLHPSWTLNASKERAHQVESVLRGEHWQDFCRQLHSTPFPKKQPITRQKDLNFTVAVLTRSRYCTQQGVFNWDIRSGSAEKHNEKAWFQHQSLAWKKDCRVVYGHWAAMGLVPHEKHVLGLDSGCVWGGKLSMMKLKQGASETNHGTLFQTHA